QTLRTGLPVAARRVRRRGMQARLCVGRSLAARGDAATDTDLVPGGDCEIARWANAKHAKTVAKKYLAARLRVDEVIEYTPLVDLDLDLSGAKQPRYSRGGRALTAEQYRAAIEYLLAADPEDVEAPRRGRWTREQRVIERAACIDQ